MNTEFHVIIERDEEGFYVATVPELRGCHTQARSLDMLMERVREVVDLCLEEQGPPDSVAEFIGGRRITELGLSNRPDLDAHASPQE